MQKRTLNFAGRLLSLERPIVMGIVNLTPDSFYSKSRVSGEEALRERLSALRREGATIADLGAYSTRPGASPVTAREERERLEPALRLLRDEYPELLVSVDTFRAEVARWAVEEWGATMINDVSGGEIDKAMFETVASLGVPYILMHMRGTPETMQSLTQYTDLLTEVLDYFVERVTRLRELGQTDIVLDPGFGFAKTLEQNYQLMATMERLKEALELPLLVGISRKSMIYRALDTTPEESLTGTTVLNTYSLLHGADILRVHDVEAATQAIELTERLRKASREENSILRFEP